MINFSSEFNLNISGHRDIEFVDVPVDTDVRLFIDPGLIESGQDPFSRACAADMKAYFDSVFECCRREDYTELRRLFACCAEINHTHLGNSQNRPCGRGASEKILMDIFTAMIEQRLFEQGIILSPCDVYVLARNFDKDRMSDLLTNVLQHQLVRFTNHVCDTMGVPQSRVSGGRFWDAEAQQWCIGSWRLPVVGINPIILVPKWFVSQSYHYTTGGYISKFLLEYRKQYHLDTRSDLCHEREMKNGTLKLVPPTKAELRAKELAGQPYKEHAIDFVLNNPDTMDRFLTERVARFKEGEFTLSDHELDMLLYTSRFRSA